MDYAWVGTDQKHRFLCIGSSSDNCFKQIESVEGTIFCEEYTSIGTDEKKIGIFQDRNGEVEHYYVRRYKVDGLIMTWDEER